MKKSVLLASSLILSLSVNIVLAECIGPIVNGRCLTGVDSSGRKNNSDDYYQGSSGSRYEYDMSNGGDRNRYSIDLNAQRRDQMNTGVGRSQDRLRGQYGGGIYND
ncbi:secreted protein [methanotrophic bacterial endosymbiont of Bathymodiolus sp.]|nr:secreted protein [methanotrophic bacterial endosymbiont of Bathymodiolus sp.]